MKTKIATLLLAALVAVSLVGTAFAANTTATVPVTLTVSNEYRAVNVTLPVSLPVEVINGVVYTADNATITNNATTQSDDQICAAKFIFSKKIQNFSTTGKIHQIISVFINFLKKLQKKI